MNSIILNAYHGILSADLKNDFKKIFGKSVWFKLQSHAEQNWTIWNMFYDCGVATVCFIDRRDTDEFDAEKTTALKELLKKYHLTLCGFCETDPHYPYYCIKYDETADEDNEESDDDEDKCDECGDDERIGQCVNLDCNKLFCAKHGRAWTDEDAPDNIFCSEKCYDKVMEEEAEDE